MTRYPVAITFLANVLLPILASHHNTPSFNFANDEWKVKPTMDFDISGEGSADNWNNSDWLELSKDKDAGVGYQTKFKMLYSDSGIYCLYYCEDKKVTATINEDFLDLWHEDVVEVFFWTDESVPIYFEYELSPLNHELPLIVPNFNGKFLGWRPWHYEGRRKVRHATHINKNGNVVTSWTAEFFIPYALLAPLNNVPAQKGTRWRANFYRIDYDNGEASWQWQTVRTNFHDYQSFGHVLFD
ncbi:MAG TPA: carbohydrate-binding family 9-like protein [Chitinophagaceae bacterium]|nr:carbohydrate-binding family 9-like protein [Chitinophagaceae bacterium]